MLKRNSQRTADHFLWRQGSFTIFFFFNDTATTEIYTLSLHDALPILAPHRSLERRRAGCIRAHCRHQDRKSTRLNSSHGYTSYAVFCLKKKKVMTRKLATPKTTGTSRKTPPRPSSG